MAEQKKQEAELLADILKELAKREGDVGEELARGGSVAQSLLQAYFQPQSEQERAVQGLLQLEMAERSGQVPKERRKDFVRMREFLEMQAGLRRPDELDRDVLSGDKGFGYVSYGDKSHFIGDDDPRTGKPREYVTGSPEFKARLKKMEEQRKRHDGVLSEPGRIMQRYQDVYDQHERAKQQANAKHSQFFDQNTASYGGRVGSKLPAPGVSSQQHEWLNSSPSGGTAPPAPHPAGQEPKAYGERRVTGKGIKDAASSVVQWLGGITTPSWKKEGVQSGGAQRANDIHFPGEAQRRNIPGRDVGDINAAWQRTLPEIMKNEWRLRNQQ